MISDVDRDFSGTLLNSCYLSALEMQTIDFISVKITPVRLILYLFGHNLSVSPFAIWS